MTDTFALPRKLLVFGIVLPLAIYVGYRLASPNMGSLAMVGFFLLILTIPIFLRWHHTIMVLCWNLSTVVFFLPGSPPLWMLAGLIGLGVILLSRILDKEIRLLNVPAVSWALVLLAFLVLFTMKMTGTIGLRSMGGTSYGGKKYVYIIFAVVAYFALSTRPIPVEKAIFYIRAFLLPGLTPVCSNLIYILGPSMWFLFYIFPTDPALGQAMEDMQLGPGAVKLGRLGGLAFGSTALLSYMLARYGVRQIFDWSRPWRLLVFVAVFAVSLLGGYRSILILNGLLFGVQFFLEGLHRTRLFPALVLAGVVLAATIFPFVDKLPLSAQRTLSILPLKVSPVARMDAQVSTAWRLEMWSVLWPEVAKHFWLGKGYTASATDYYLALESEARGMAKDYELAMVAGDYHNGFLSIMIPFGIFGLLIFLFFIGAGIRVLYFNYLNGHPALKIVNTFLLVSFGVRVFFFFAIFGGIHGDILMLAGLVGFSISLNHGLRKVPVEVEPVPEPPKAIARSAPHRVAVPVVRGRA